MFKFHIRWVLAPNELELYIQDIKQYVPSNSFELLSYSMHTVSNFISILFSTTVT